MRIRTTVSQTATRWGVGVAALAAIVGMAQPAAAQQRVLGVDISYWNNGSTSNGTPQSAWNTAYTTPNANGYTRHFAWIRATRGGTTGLSQSSGTPGGGSQDTLSRRYDDSRFLQNITRATNAGFLVAPYHFGRPDIAGNTGTDEANHFIEMAGIFMRPGYLMPVFDLEAGTSANNLATFSIAFSNQIYNVLGIRPGMYTNGNHTSHLVGSATPAQLATIAQPQAQTPSVVGPAFPMLWNARYSDQANPESIPIQTGEPKHTYTTVNSYYGPWDDYGDNEPWNFWQFSSTTSVPGFNTVDGDIDSNVAHGDIEYVRNYLVPAVWMNDNSGDWSTLANWNSGREVTVPQQGPGQAPAYSYDAGALPVPRLPGANSGIGATHGQYDTVILERPNANITVTHSSGTTNIRKLYMRETLEITGGSFTINYNPLYRPDNSSEVRHGGPLSAQFSGAVTLGGTGSLSVHTLQVDATRTFTLAGGTLTFDKINLMPHASNPAKIDVTGDLSINPLANATATIAPGAGGGSTGFVDLNGGNRTFNVGNGPAIIDLSVDVPITNGGLTKNGNGTMRLNAANTFAGPVTINAGTVRYGHASGLAATSLVTINNGATLDMNHISDSIAGLAGNTTAHVAQGAADLTLDTPSGTTSFTGEILATGALTKSGEGTQTLIGNNDLGPVNLNAGGLRMIGNSSTGTVTVNGGTLSGTGSLSGNVVLNSGGTFAPGTSIDTIAVGGLTVEAGSVLDFELTTFSGFNFGDLIDVTSPDGLSINGGTLNLTGVGSVNEGLFTLINYDGALNGSLENLTITSSLPEEYNFELIDSGSSIDLFITFGLDGDFNSDGSVDMADYVVWRKGLGTIYSLEHYDLWAANYGVTSGGSSARSSGTVPEPASILLLALCGGMVALAGTTRRRVR